jgi:predicted ATP-grasp superfamily ATP-dependent carboligase
MPRARSLARNLPRHLSCCQLRRRGSMRKAASTAIPAMACVIGGLSMVRALGRCGIPVALAGPEPHPDAARSRYCLETVLTPSWVDEPDAAVDALLAWARTKPEPPVLFYQGDHDLLALSRARDRLDGAVRVVLPKSDLVEALVDKLGFAALAERTHLPVPNTLVVHRGDDLPPADWSDFPCVLKPAIRGHWTDSPLVAEASAVGQKAIRVQSRAELEQMASLIRAHETDFVLQAEVFGGEENIVSYHAYVRSPGEVAAEFTGRKVRTLPRRYGFSTCVEITDDLRVMQLGREVLDRLGFCGVVKVDFKEEARTGELYLLELNPRFNLWHHPGTVAGVGIPELVYADCTASRTRHIPSTARAGVRWVSPREDLSAVREEHPRFGLSRARWLGEVLTCEVNEGFDLHDPWPGLVDLAETVARKVKHSGRALTARAMPRGR